MTKTRKILFVASEAVPFAKTGGLADVCGALPKALKKAGHDVRLVLPRYWCVARQKFGLREVIAPMGVPMGCGPVWCSVLEGKTDGVPAYFVEHENYFGRNGLYDDGKWEYSDNAERFGFFSKAALQICKELSFQPDIVHVNDWQTALAAAYLKIHEFHNPFFQRTASVLTIHNLAYQGSYGPRDYSFLALGDGNFTGDRFENYQGVNILKGGIFFADAINAVSPTYAREILSEPGGNGLSVYFGRRREDLSGVLNGADYDHWNPETDPVIPARFSSEDLSGKAICKQELQKEFYLETNEKVPLIGVVTRFTFQKGFRELAPAIKEIVRQMKVQFVFLGCGEKWMEDFYGGLPAEFPGKIGTWIGHDNRKAHLVMSGSDLFLMPSLYEPCGLTQLYSLRYGTLPIVRGTGGLCDTVEQYDEQTGCGTGFRFQDLTPSALYNTVGWAVSTYYARPRHFARMREAAMRADFSWKESAEKYTQIYDKALARRAAWR